MRSSRHRTSFGICDEHPQAGADGASGESRNFVGHTGSVGDGLWPVELVERDDVRAEITGFLTAQWPASLVLHGPPGIGKSSIVAEARVQASGLGAEVWAARASEAEQVIAFAALDVVLRGAGGADLWSGPGSPALAAALGGRVPAGALDVRSVGLELSELLAQSSARGPLLLVIDDAQWIDPTSEQVLTFALRRVEMRPVAMLLATRPGGLECSLALAGALSGADVLGHRPGQLAIRPLTVGATGRVVRDRLGVRLSHGALIRLHDACGGNPLVALELARTLVEGEPLAVWEQGDLMRRRVAGLDEGARTLVAIIGLVGEPDLGLVDAVLAQRGMSAITALSAAVQADAVVLRADRLRASHPLLASAAVDLLPDRHRRSLHAAIAEHTDSLELAAVHTALSCQGPDPRSAALLAQAAERCAIQGASVRAAELAGLSVEFTPAGDHAALSRSLLQARLLLRAGEPGAAGAALDAAERLARVPADQVEVLLGRRDLEMAGDNRAAAHQAALAALHLAGEDMALRARCHAALAGCTPLGVDDEVAHARAVLDLVDESSDPNSVLSAIQTIVLCQVAAGDGIDPALVARVDALRGREIEHTIDRPEATMEMVTRTDGESWRPRGAWARCCCPGPGPTGMRPRDRTCCSKLPAPSCGKGTLWRRCACSTRLTSSATRSGWTTLPRLPIAPRPWPWQVMSRRRPTWPGRAWPRPSSETPLGCPAAQPRTRAGRPHPGRSEHVRRPLWALRAEAADLGVVEPAFLATDLDLLDALAGLGDTERLGDLASDLESAAARGQLAWTRVAAARGQVMLAATGPLEALVEAIRRCDEVVASVTSRYEHARADLAAGRVLQRRGRRGEARARLDRARVVLDGLGASGLAAICSREGARLGGRVPSGSDLTASEQQVVDLAARGCPTGNRRQLVIGPRTVESHLSSAYRKLQVPGRKALIRMLSQRQP